MRKFSRLFVACLFLLVACGPDSDEIVVKKSEYLSLKGINTPPEYPKALLIPETSNEIGKIRFLEVVAIDSCEYIMGYTKYNDGGPVLTHKGNCKYCIERELRMHRMAFNYNWNTPLLDREFSWKKR
jgi:hypothetical protein